MIKPALVYCTEETDHDDLDRFLISRRLYRYDDLPELAGDLDKPVLERPILRRLMTFTNRPGTPVQVNDARTFRHEPVPEYLIVENVGTLGPDIASQVAVVGALMEAGVRVVADYRELTRGWYFDQLQLRDSKLVHRTIADLMGNPDGDTCRDWWEWRNPGDTWFLPTTHSPVRSYASAQERIRELVHDRRLTPTAAVPFLQVAGYRNRKGRVRWYPKAVRDSLEEGA